MTSKINTCWLVLTALDLAAIVSYSGLMAVGYSLKDLFGSISRFIHRKTDLTEDTYYLYTTSHIPEAWMHSIKCPDLSFEKAVHRLRSRNYQFALKHNDS